MVKTHPDNLAHTASDYEELVYIFYIVIILDYMNII